MGEVLRALVDDILDLDRIHDDTFRGRSPQGATQRVFGGQVAAQALAAASRTAPSDRPVHSLHAYFLRPGDPTEPIVYEVDRLRDGRAFTTRRVVASQHGRPIFTSSVQFHTDEPGLEHADTIPAVPAPESVPQTPRLLPRSASGEPEPWAWGEYLELRYLQAPDDASQRVWFRTVDPLPDDAVLHACVLAYASDMTLLGVALTPHTDPREAIARATVQMGSLDHAIWFHAPARLDEWLLYDQRSPWAGGARGLATGSIWRRDGQLVATVLQEGLIRVRPTPTE